MKKLVLAAALIAAPLAARADTGLRIGLEAQIATHDATTGTNWITDNWPLAGDLMLSYWTPGSIVSFDLEFSEQFYLSSPSGQSGRIGTVIRPGIRISPPVIPIYIRGALPINVETAEGLSQKEIAGSLVISSKTVAGGSQISAFNRQSIWLTSGLDFRF